MTSIAHVGEDTSAYQPQADASRESELMRAYDLATIFCWIGNAPAVAAKHDAMSLGLDASPAVQAMTGDTGNDCVNPVTKTASATIVMG